MCHFLRRIFLTLAAVALATAAAAQGVLPDGAKWEKVSSAGKTFGEGVVAARDGTLYLVEIAPPGAVFRYNPANGETTTVMDPSGGVGGLHVDKNGDLLIARGIAGGAPGIVRRNLATGAMTVLADKYQGKPFVSPNDLTSDAQGRIYFSDSRFGSEDEPQLPNAIYRLDPDGKVTQLSTDMVRPNGIEVSPDGKRLYVADDDLPRFKVNPHGPAVDKFGVTRGGVVVYDLAPDGGISNGRLFYRNDTLMPDGMAMDTDGNLYVAMHNIPERGMVVLDPAGKVIQELPLPEQGVTTQFGFGRGADAGSLYVTTGLPWGLWRIKTTRKGFYQ